MTKAGIQGLAAGRSDTYRIALDDLHLKPGWNCRDRDFDPTDAADIGLARSIAERGVVEPLTAIFEDGKVYVTNGHRRRAAALHARDVLGAEIKTVPVQTEARYSSEADHVLSQIVRNSGKPLSSYEQARVFKRLMDLGWTEADIATKTGLSRQWVVDLLNLQAAPAGVTDLVKSGEVSATLASRALKASRGDAVKAGETLAAGVAKAKAGGKSRATAKHVMPPRPMFRPADDLGPGLTAAIEIVQTHLAGADGRDRAVIQMILDDIEARRDAGKTAPAPTIGRL